MKVQQVLQNSPGMMPIISFIWIEIFLAPAKKLNACKHLKLKTRHQSCLSWGKLINARITDHTCQTLKLVKSDIYKLIR